YAAGAACLTLLIPARGGFSVDPRRLVSVPAPWHETSLWLTAHAGSGYLIDYRSEYSNWDAGRDLRRAYVLSAPEAELRSYVERHGVRFALLDRAVGLPDSFLDWKRCFSDPGKPSRLSVFSAR